MRYLLVFFSLALVEAACAQGIIKSVSEPIYTPVPQYTITPEIEQRAAKRAAVYTRAYRNLQRQQQQSVPLWYNPPRPIYVVPQPYYYSPFYGW